MNTCWSLSIIVLLSTYSLQTLLYLYTQYFCYIYMPTIYICLIPIGIRFSCLHKIKISIKYASKHKLSVIMDYYTLYIIYIQNNFHFIMSAFKQNCVNNKFHHSYRIVINYKCAQNAFNCS